jgi:hypothetical protein
MKIVKCPFCYTEKEVAENVIISLCPVCLNEMKEVKKDGGN